MPQLILDLNTHTDTFADCLLSPVFTADIYIFQWRRSNRQSRSFLAQVHFGTTELCGKPWTPRWAFLPERHVTATMHLRPYCSCLDSCSNSWSQSHVYQHFMHFLLLLCQKDQTRKSTAAVLLLLFSLHSGAIVRSDRYSSYILITYVTLQTHSPLSSIRRTNCDMPPATGDFFLQSLSLIAEHNLFTEGRSMWSWWCRLSRKCKSMLPQNDVTAD